MTGYEDSMYIYVYGCECFTKIGGGPDLAYRP